MDDLDHSVLIAEQDWDCFYTESEECSFQQAELAALDDSGLSDTEDDKISTHVLSYPEEAQKFAENSNLKNESVGQTSDTTLNKENVTSEYFGLDHNKSNEESSQMEPPPLDTTNLKGNSESQVENKSSQADIRSEASSLFWDANHENGTENTGREVTDSLPLLRKEKERWFVTVNDSPVRMREKVVTSGQKKRRKKKTSRNGSQRSAPDRERRSSVNNTEEEKETFERQSVPENFDKPPKRDSTDLISTTYLNNHKENLLSNSHNIQDLQSSSSIEPTPDNLSHFINHTEEGSPSFILGASTTLYPANSQGETTAQQELFGQESSSQETACLESSSNRAQTPDETSGPTRPIFAMSSFWDEMEKWTINDILELRIANNKHLLKESFIPEQDDTFDTIDPHVDQVDSKDDNIDDSGLIDDAADSDYFTYLDDCKPDRSSCEFSTFSDYDKEFLQLCVSTNPSPVPCKSNEQTQTFLEPTCARNLFQEDSDQILPSYQSELNEIVRMYSESDLPLFMYSEVESRTHDVLLKPTRDNNMSSFLIDQCDVRRSSPSPVLSIFDILDDQGRMSFLEILNDDKDSEQLQTRTNISVSFPSLQNLPSVPETYDNFFTEFEVGNFLFPSVKGTTQCEKNMVPIYSSSRSVVKDLTFPEVEETIESDSEDESMPIRVVTHFSGQQKCASPSGTPNLCFNTNQRNTWRNLSLRRIKFSFMGRTWCRMATSWGSQKNSTGNTAFQGNWDISTTSNSSKAHPKLPVLLLEDQTLQHSTDREIYLEQTVRGSGIERFCYSLKQADMCLVCIAFASWVLKSTNPQSTDMWKTALLANVSAISAIQYLRQYIKEEDEP
ncbi:hypothetical protein E1301_Tti005025 [Triplophysa tibetana]|uniref:PGC-1 and ERR-induced regulator in muscle protein 1 n=1 Tax=Triplophysa tibetana TaxID=1572043 RepID=A0A5A9NTP6_9TELE|nr:hypothetical protein E1301_Tti005025 [Triplophysa tibetana]